MFGKALVVAACTAGYTAANSVPIYGTYPGWIQGGGQANIEVEIFMDFLCSDAKAAYQPFVDALNTPVSAGSDTTVLDAITLKVSSFPLDYRIHSW